MGIPGKKSATPVSNQAAPQWFGGVIADITQQTPEAKSFLIKAKGFPTHIPGQHVDLRLTAPDGYQAVRKYSIGSAPDDNGQIELTVQMMPDGEVSGYLDNVATVGTQLEVKGPLGGYFIWDSQDSHPIVLIGGGSGVVPLMSILRSHQHVQSMAPLTLLLSSRNIDHVLYRKELLDRPAFSSEVKIIHTLTDQQPPAWTGYRRRIDSEMLRHVVQDIEQSIFYVCGPTAMVEAVANTLVDMGVNPGRVKTERFGPTG
jgi:ferredoxin-NADP reductase